MKTKRFVSTLLALLLICSLPVSAFAEIPEVKEGQIIDNNTESILINQGTVKVNNGLVDHNHGTVEVNNAEMTFNLSNGTVGTNNSTGTVTTNEGTVTTNEGTVNSNGIISNHDKAIVTTNTGTVNNNYGTVTTNGTEDNNLNAKVNLNNGTVTTNNGTVTTNGGKGIVTDNNGTVTTNGGTVTTNNGTVETNGHIVETNNGFIFGNEGQVTTNNGTVDYNPGTVEINNGIVNNNDNGVTINNTTGLVNGDRPGTNYGTVKQGDTTWYGVLVDNDGTKTLEEYCEPNKVLDFSQLTKEGYVYAGYTQEYQLLNGVLTKLAITVNDTSYTVTCPNVLTLIWQAIVSPAAATDDGAGSFGPGSVISLGGHKFLLVAVVEDVYCLASVDSFEDEALSDLPALLSSLLTEEQLSHVTGEPELLDEALTARFFAGQGSHIVFPCDSGLIFS